MTADQAIQTLLVAIEQAHKHLTATSQPDPATVARQLQQTAALVSAELAQEPSHA